MSLKKKLLCLILCTVIISSLSITVWAETKTDLMPSSKTVFAYYDTTSATDDVYSVDLNWGELVFKYVTSEGVWNPDSHTYSGASQGWVPETEGGDLVRITNHSNVAINANVHADTTYSVTVDEVVSSPFTLLVAKNGETPSVSSSIMLNSPAIGSAAAPFTEFTISLTGTPEDTMTSKTQIGKISIILTKAE